MEFGWHKVNRHCSSYNERGRWLLHHQSTRSLLVFQATVVPHLLADRNTDLLSSRCFGRTDRRNLLLAEPFCGGILLSELRLFVAFRRSGWRLVGLCAHNLFTVGHLRQSHAKLPSVCHYDIGRVHWMGDWR